MSYQFKNITVLVVESTRAMFDLTRSVLQAFGVNQVYSAYSCDEGFEAFCRLNPDLVIIDWLQEPKNGLELTRSIRVDEKSPNPFTPIVLMTGYSQKRRVLMARDSGITEFLVKPFTAKALYQKIEQLIERPRHFVSSENYFGPDRRRKRQGDYSGPERRTDEPEVRKLEPEVLPPVTKTAKSAAKGASNVSSAVQKAKDIKKRYEKEKSGKRE
ncbi:MAG: response regulator [Alphaproteobacteria bacterium]|nr:response regulator [Alphaproteobacteria bacterium]